MKRTRFVTFPRSGHHWLIRMLQATLGDEFRYSEFYENGLTLENSPEINAQKTHDFDLDVPIRDDIQHIVQFRNPEDAITSWYKSHSGEDVKVFAKEKMQFFFRWMDKWVYGYVPNRLIVCYVDMLTDVETVVDTVLLHLGDEGCTIITEPAILE